MRNIDLKFVKDRCQKKYSYSDEKINLLVDEFKKYIALCILFPNTQLEMFSEDVDNVWHEFILFTQQYHKFCNTYSGKYIHHSPHIDNDMPTPDEIINKSRTFIQYYKQTFNEEPPSHIWKFENNRCTGCAKCKNGCGSNCSNNCASSCAALCSGK